MKYRERRPAAALRPYVECVWTISGPRVSSPRAPERVVPGRRVDTIGIRFRAGEATGILPVDGGSRMRGTGGLMAKQMVSVLALALMAAAPFAAPAPAGGVQALEWMAGTWAGEKDGVAMEELWTSPRGGALLGVHRDVKGESLLSWEFLRIQATDTGIVFFASPRSAPPTPFKMIEMRDKRVVFENKEHDFPQRILYWLDARGALHARIEGPQGGKTVSEEWVWTRRIPLAP